MTKLPVWRHVWVHDPVWGYRDISSAAFPERVYSVIDAARRCVPGVLVLLALLLRSSWKELRGGTGPELADAPVLSSARSHQTLNAFTEQYSILHFKRRGCHM